MSFIYNPFTGNLDFVCQSGADSAWDRVSSTVNSTSSLVVDSVSNALFQSIKFHVAIFNQANTSYRSFELNVLNNNGNYKETKSNKITGNGPNISISVVNNAGTLELQVTNNESYNLNVEIGRLILN